MEFALKLRLKRTVLSVVIKKTVTAHCTRNTERLAVLAKTSQIEHIMISDEHNDDDFNLFRAAVGDVKRIVDDRAETGKPAPKPIPQQLHNDEKDVLDNLLSYTEPDDLNLADEINFHQPGIQHSVMRKLRRGQYTINSELDLHGMNAVQARQAMTGFLAAALQAHYQCVRIIHGKGLRSSNDGPVLKPMTVKWLSRREEVLAFCSARSTDGGTGALYVLLKKY